jgi:hypothetical protein
MDDLISGVIPQPQLLKSISVLAHRKRWVKFNFPNKTNAPLALAIEHY